jgi:cytochrome c biogenesis protein CcdA
MPMDLSCGQGYRRPMNSNEWPRAVTTASIWLSLGFSLGFGLFRMNFSGPGQIMLPFLAILLVGGGIVATAIVWKSKASSSNEP